jgi:16S rRNA processing protein RimM
MWKSLIDELIEIGKVSGAAGIKGEIKLYHYSGERERLVGVRELFFKSDGGMESYPVESIRYAGNGRTPIVKSPKISDRSAAEAMIGRQVFLRPEDLAPLDADSFYVKELVGAEVYDEGGALIGTVKEIVDNPAHDIIIVEHDGGSFMLPLVDVFVRSVEFGADGEPARITVALPAGIEETGS